MKKNIGLVNKVNTIVRFSEVDSMGVVWHGNYVRFLEDGREAFGKQYKLGYFDVFNYGLMTPIVKLEIDFKNMVRYGSELEIITEYIPSKAAKINFNYIIFNKSTNNELILKASSTQVFIDEKGELQLINPDFYVEWQKKWGLM